MVQIGAATGTLADGVIRASNCSTPPVHGQEAWRLGGAETSPGLNAHSFGEAFEYGWLWCGEVHCSERVASLGSWSV
jgi:hypothetical protein